MGGQKMTRPRCGHTSVASLPRISQFSYGLGGKARYVMPAPVAEVKHLKRKPASALVQGLVADTALGATSLETRGVSVRIILCCPGRCDLGLAELRCTLRWGGPERATDMSVPAVVDV